MKNIRPKTELIENDQFHNFLPKMAEFDRFRAEMPPNYFRHSTSYFLPKMAEFGALCLTQNLMNSFSIKLINLNQIAATLNNFGAERFRLFVDQQLFFDICYVTPKNAVFVIFNFQIALDVAAI